VLSLAPHVRQQQAQAGFSFAAQHRCIVGHCPLEHVLIEVYTCAAQLAHALHRSSAGITLLHSIH